MNRRFASLALALPAALMFAQNASAKIWPEDFVTPTEVMERDRGGVMTPSSDEVETPTYNGMDAADVVELEDVPADPTVIGEGTVSRVEFIAALVSRSFWQSDLDYCFQELGVGEFSLLFKDVPVEHPYAAHLCVAMKSGLVRGYADSSFRPDQKISASEAAVIFSRMAGLEVLPAKRGVVWYKPYMDAVRGMGMTMLPQNGATLITGSMFKQMICTLSTHHDSLLPRNEDGCSM